VESVKGKVAGCPKLLAEKGKLTMPIFALGGEHSFGMQMAEIMRSVASDVTGGVITDSGHWVMEEQPRQTTAAIVKSVQSKGAGRNDRATMSLAPTKVALR
jgi:pimeloyl-ACP methyl ester carboxylesterase